MKEEGSSYFYFHFQGMYAKHIHITREGRGGLRIEKDQIHMKKRIGKEGGGGELKMGTIPDSIGR